MRVSAKSLNKSYRDAGRELVILSDVTFDFESGTSIGIIGRSGVGKSTLLHLLGGLDRASSGSVSYDGADISQLDDDAMTELRGRKVGFIFQFHHLLPEFSALENVSMPLIIQGHSSAEALTRAGEILKRVGLSERVEHRPSELSGGEQQRVAIARAMVGKPELILADEPTGNLDVHTAGAIQKLLRDVVEELGSTLVVVTHSHELAKSMQKVVEMHPGGALRPIGAS